MEIWSVLNNVMELANDDGDTDFGRASYERLERRRRGIQTLEWEVRQAQDLQDRALMSRPTHLRPAN